MGRLKQSGSAPVRARMWRRIAMRWRWYHFYFLLALVDLVVIGASLALFHSTIGQYQVALSDLSVVDEKLRWLTQLRSTVTELNAPGNDIFESRRPAHERARFDQTLRRFESLITQAEDYNVRLQSFRAHADAMIKEEEEILDTFAGLVKEAPGKRDAGERFDEAVRAMAVMDRHQAEALAALAMTEKRIQDGGSYLLEAYGRRLHASARSERYIFGIVVLILLGMFWYGRKLQKTHDQMIADRHNAMEERHARLAVVGEVCSSVAHGIRNPLAAIISSAQLALEFGTLDSATRLRVEDVLTEGRRLDLRVTRLLDFSRVPDRALEPFNLVGIVRQAIGEISIRLDERGMQIHTDYEPDSLIVHGNSDQIAQSILEIIGNTLDHAPSGSRLHIACRKDKDVDGCAQISISDEGPGIPSAFRDRAFNLFYTSKAEGNGIGLAFVKRTAELHGGSVIIDESNTGGCRTVISLPLA